MSLPFSGGVLTDCCMCDVWLSVCVRGVQLEVLKAVHALGWLAIDVKPDNVMVGAGAGADDVFLIDWGCALKYLDFSKQFVPGGDHGGNDLYRSLYSHAQACTWSPVAREVPGFL